MDAMIGAVYRFASHRPREVLFGRIRVDRSHLVSTYIQMFEGSILLPI